ncbi:hypothetical protein ACVVIH_06955 [Chryseobacterium arthrosphaerae]
MIRLKPIEVPGYLIPFILKECDGICILKDGGYYKQILIEPKSVIGHFISNRIQENKSVKEYCLTIYCKKIDDKIKVGSEILNFYNSSEFSIDMSFEDLDYFYKFLDSYFRTYFCFFVKGYCRGNIYKNKIKKAINEFCKMYDLLEYGYSENQMRILYYRYTNNGVLSLFQNNNKLNYGFFGVT